MMKQYRDLIYLLIVITLAFILFYKQPFQENLTLPIGGNIFMDNKKQLVPTGSIIAYYPPNGDLTANPPPEGWAVCDGRNGTPDLRGRFLRMYSNDIGEFTAWGGHPIDTTSGLGYDSGLAGTSRKNVKGWVFNHKIGDKAGTDATELSIDELPPHNHGLPLRYWTNNVNWNAGDGPAPIADNQVNDSNRYYTSNTGRGWGHNNQPPYFVIVYIMKM